MATPAPGRAYVFDVISIRVNKTGLSPEAVAQDGPTADGFRSRQTLLLPLMTASVPQAGGAAFYSLQEQIKGLPDWVMTERYDIDARIADQDRAEWQKPQSQKAMLQAMLQALLADRCKLAVHREVKETQVTTLVVAKGGPKLKETDPAVEHPGGRALPLGGVIVTNKDGMSFYGISMASLASFVSSFANRGRPVQDKTGLTGRYDVTFDTLADAADSGVSSFEAAFLSGLNKLGLKLDSENGQVETLVIDHIERPSAN